MKNKNQYITLEKFKEQIDLGVGKGVEDKFFKKISKMTVSEKWVIKTQKNSDDLCFICYDSKNIIYLKPCRHTGFCWECFLDYIKRKLVCPFCKNYIESAYIFHYDHE